MFATTFKSGSSGEYDRGEFFYVVGTKWDGRLGCVLSRENTKNGTIYRTSVKPTNEENFVTWISLRPNQMRKDEAYYVGQDQKARSH